MAAVLFKVNCNLAGWVPRVALHPDSVHSLVFHDLENPVAEGINAGTRDQYRVGAKSAQVAGHIEWRPPEYGAVRKYVHQDFAEQYEGGFGIGSHWMMARQGWLKTVRKKHGTCVGPFSTCSQRISSTLNNMCTTVHNSSNAGALQGLVLLKINPIFSSWR